LFTAEIAENAEIKKNIFLSPAFLGVFGDHGGKYLRHTC